MSTTYATSTLLSLEPETLAPEPRERAWAAPVAPLPLGMVAHAITAPAMMGTTYAASGFRGWGVGSVPAPVTALPLPLGMMGSPTLLSPEPTRARMGRARGPNAAWDGGASDYSTRAATTARHDGYFLCNFRV